MNHPLKTSLACMALCLCAFPASAVSLGMLDTFQDGSTQGWGSGAPNPVPPTNVATGGPTGAGDRFLLISSTGAGGPGSRPVGINGTQWAGDYITAGVTGISMDLRNLGSTELTMRLALFGQGPSSVSTTSITLPAGGAWTQAYFPLTAAGLTGDALTVLTNVVDLRLFHGTTAVFPGGAIAASLGVDNIRAVPEPDPSLLMLAGLAALVWMRRARRND